MTQLKSEDRVLFLDYMRVIATFMVIVVHSCEFFYISGDSFAFASDADRLWVSLWDSAFRVCVPLFAMMSGYLLLPLGEEQSVSTFYRKRFERVFVPFIIWYLLYAILPILWSGTDGASIGQNLVYILLNFNGTNGHLWFVYMLIGLYLFMPILSPWLSKVSKRGEQAFLMVWFLTTFYHAAKTYLPALLGDLYQPAPLGGVDQLTLWGECYWNEFHSLWYFSGFIGYVVLAHYIRKYIDWGINKSLMVGGALFLAGFAITFGEFYGRALTTTTLYDLELSWRFCSFNVAMMTCGAFIMMKSIKCSNPMIYNPIKEMSKLSYGVYLMHIFILNWAFNLLNGCFESSLATIFAVAITTFTLCFVAAKLLSLLPKSRYIV